jgi:hypothetical protein
LPNVDVRVVKWLEAVGVVDDEGCDWDHEDVSVVQTHIDAALDKVDGLRHDQDRNFDRNARLDGDWQILVKHDNFRRARKHVINCDG